MFLSQAHNFLFYRHAFTLRNILKGGLNYIFYLMRIDKICFNSLTINFLITSFCNLNCDICSFQASKNIAGKVFNTARYRKIPVYSNKM